MDSSSLGGEAARKLLAICKRKQNGAKRIKAKRDSGVTMGVEDGQVRNMKAKIKDFLRNRYRFKFRHAFSYYTLASQMSLIHNIIEHFKEMKWSWDAVRKTLMEIAEDKRKAYRQKRKNHNELDAELVRRLSVPLQSVSIFRSRPVKPGQYLDWSDSSQERTRIRNLATLKEAQSTLASTSSRGKRDKQTRTEQHTSADETSQQPTESDSSLSGDFERPARKAKNNRHANQQVSGGSIRPVITNQLQGSTHGGKSSARPNAVMAARLLEHSSETSSRKPISKMNRNKHTSKSSTNINLSEKAPENFVMVRNQRVLMAEESDDADVEDTEADIDDETADESDIDGSSSEEDDDSDVADNNTSVAPTRKSISIDWPDELDSEEQQSDAAGQSDSSGTAESGEGEEVLDNVNASHEGSEASSDEEEDTHSAHVADDQESSSDENKEDYTIKSQNTQISTRRHKKRPTYDEIDEDILALFPETNIGQTPSFSKSNKSSNRSEIQPHTEHETPSSEDEEDFNDDSDSDQPPRKKKRNPEKAKPKPHPPVHKKRTSSDRIVFKEPKLPRSSQVNTSSQHRTIKSVVQIPTSSFSVSSIPPIKTKSGRIVKRTAKVTQELVRNKQKIKKKAAISELRAENKKKRQAVEALLAAHSNSARGSDSEESMSEDEFEESNEGGDVDGQTQEDESEESEGEDPAERDASLGFVVGGSINEEEYAYYGIEEPKLPSEEPEGREDIRSTPVDRPLVLGDMDDMDFNASQCFGQGMLAGL